MGVWTRVPRGMRDRLTGVLPDWWWTWLHQLREIDVDRLVFQQRVGDEQVTVAGRLADHREGTAFALADLPEQRQGRGGNRQDARYNLVPLRRPGVLAAARWRRQARTILLSSQHPWDQEHAKSQDKEQDKALLFEQGSLPN